MEQTQANYNLAIFTLRNLLDYNSDIGSNDDLEVMRLARFIEDYEAARIPTNSKTASAFEPYYIDSTAQQ